MIRKAIIEAFAGPCEIREGWLTGGAVLQQEGKEEEEERGSAATAHLDLVRIALSSLYLNVRQYEASASSV